MKSWLRRLRGALGMGLTWAAGWIPIGAVTGWITGAVFGFPLAGVAVNYAVLFGVLGFAGGALFSGVLRLTEGRRRFDQLSLPRFTAWGAVGGALLGGAAVGLSLLGAGINILGAVAVGLTTLLGAGSAAATLALARAADDRDLLSSGEDAAEVGLSEAEARRLLDAE